MHDHMLHSEGDGEGEGEGEGRSVERISGKRHQAFIFVKPHAMTEAIIGQLIYTQTPTARSPVRHPSTIYSTRYPTTQSPSHHPPSPLTQSQRW